MNNDTFTNVISEAMAGSTEGIILLCILLIVYVITGGSAIAMMTANQTGANQTGTAAALMFVAILAVVFIVMPM